MPVSPLKCLVVAGLALNMSLSSFAEDPPGWLEKDFADLTALFEGRWDNDRHVFFADAAGHDAETLAPRQHIEITREATSEDSDVIFKALRSVEGEAPTTLFHHFEMADDHTGIHHSFSVEAEDTSRRTFECQVIWQRDGAQFRGHAEGEACATVFPRPESGGDLEITMTLSETEFWVTSRRGLNITEARMRRARSFECWTAVMRGAKHGDSAEGMRDWDFRRGLKLHDQGGIAQVQTDEEPPRDIRLKLRDVDWPYGTNRASLTLYVYEGESDRALSYAWGEAGAERIGINLRWLQASCTHVPGTE